MAKRTYRAVARVKKTDMAGFLDMLRYDEARVTDWEYGTGDAFTVSLRADKPFTIARWQSFLIECTAKEW